MTANPRGYPREMDHGGAKIILRLMTAADEAAVLAFAQSLPMRDLLFLERDITHPKVVSAWARDVEEGKIISVLALRDQQIVGCNAIVTDALSWSRHVGELRVLVSPEMRGTGLGRTLTQEAFVLALQHGLERLTAQMTPDQQGALSMFASLGFRPEALLRNHVKDRDGAPHDIVIVAHDVAERQAQHEALGISDAF